MKKFISLIALILVGGIAYGGSVNNPTQGLPSQAGNSGKILSTNGTTASWITAGGAGAIISINGDSTAAQVIASGSAGSDFAISNAGATHTLNLPTASATTRGALSSANWSTFNAKQTALTFGNLTAAGTDGVVVTGGTGSVIGSGASLAQHVSDSTHNGYLSSTDWSDFDGKVPYAEQTILGAPGASFYTDSSVESWNLVLTADNWLNQGTSFLSRSTDSHSGTYAMEIGGDAGPFTNITYQETTGTVGDSYTLEFWSKRGSQATATATLLFSNANFDSFWNFTGPDAGTWTAGSGGGGNPGADQMTTYSLTTSYALQTVASTQVTVPVSGSFLTLLVGGPITGDQTFFDDVTMKKDGIGPNVMVNGDFEAWSNVVENPNVLVNYTDYQLGGSDNSVRLFANTTDPRTGTYAAEINSNGSIRQIFGQLRTGLTPGDLVGVSGWAFKVLNNAAVSDVILFDDEYNVATQYYNFNTNTWDTLGTLDADHTSTTSLTVGTYGHFATEGFAVPASGKIYAAFTKDANNNNSVVYDDLSIGLVSHGSIFNLTNVSNLADLTSADTIFGLEFLGDSKYGFKLTGDGKWDTDFSNGFAFQDKVTSTGLMSAGTSVAAGTALTAGTSLTTGTFAQVGSYVHAATEVQSLTATQGGFATVGLVSTAPTLPYANDIYLTWTSGQGFSADGFGLPTEAKEGWTFTIHSPAAQIITFKHNSAGGWTSLIMAGQRDYRTSIVGGTVTFQLIKVSGVFYLKEIARTSNFDLGAVMGGPVYFDPATNKVPLAFLPTSAPNDASYVTLSTNASLDNERVLTGTTNQIVITDNGSNQPVTLSLPQSIATSSSPVFAGATFSAAVSPVSNDGAALGSASLMWSDLFLASGSVINFNNGDATITHSSGLLTSNVDIAVPDEAYGGGWDTSLEVPTKNAIYDKIQTLLQPLSGTSASIGGGALLAGACASTDTTITGATVGMVASSNPNTYPGDGSTWDSYVSAADTVTTKVCAIVALSPTASTYNIRVIQ